MRTELECEKVFGAIFAEIYEKINFLEKLIQNF